MPRTTSHARSTRFPPALTVLVAGVVLYFAREVLIPIALAVLLSFLLAPLVRRLERYRVPRMLAVGAVVGLTALGLGVLGWLVQGEVMQLAGKLPEYKHNIVAKIEALRPSEESVLAKAETALEEVEKEITKPAGEEKKEEAAAPAPIEKEEEPVPVTVVEGPTPPLTYARVMLGPILSRAATAGIVVVFAIFILMKREDLRNRLLWLFGERTLHVSTPALDDAAHRVSRYLLMQLMSNIIAGAAIGLGLLLLGVPSAALWGLLTVVLRFIPYIGTWLAAILPFATAMAVSPDWTQPLLVLGIVGTVEVVMNNVIEPLMYGSGTGLSPIAVLAAAVFWAWMWGGVGLLLATPLTVCLAVIGQHVPSLAFLHVLLGDKPVMSPAATLYQRLLAGDEDEAGKIIDTFGKDKDLARVYDELVLPAMRMAEADRHRGDLEPERAQAVRDTLGRIIEDAGAHGPLGRTEEKPAAVSVLCLPARDQSDEIAARMLAHLLVSAGVEAQALSTEMLSGEVIERVALDAPAVVCISALPPGAVRHSRVLTKRLRARSPDLPIVIGVWDSRADPHEVRRRLNGAGGETVVTTLGQAVGQIRSIAGSLGEPVRAMRADENGGGPVASPA